MSRTCTRFFQACTIASLAVIAFSLFLYTGCSVNDPERSEEFSGQGNIAIQFPVDETDGTWHLYGPQNSFYTGSGDAQLADMPAGYYTVVWWAKDGLITPKPIKLPLHGDSSILYSADYKQAAPGDDFVTILQNTFVMGSPFGPGFEGEMGRNEDEIQHYVTLQQAYLMQETEVTNQQFLELALWAVEQGHAILTETKLMDNLDGSDEELLNFTSPLTQIEYDSENETLRLKDAAYALRPVVEVTWYGAVSYCDWLSLNEDMARSYDHSTWQCGIDGDAYTAQTYRLPTEAEWEYACRAEADSAFSSGNITTGGCSDPAMDEIGWYCGNSPDRSQDVGTKPANDYGLHDMHGNVWEWCNDWYGEYGIMYFIPRVDEDGNPEIDPDTGNQYIDPVWHFGTEDDPLLNPNGPEDGTSRCLRSGRWALTAEWCRSANRLLAVPDYTGFNIGFRVAMTVPID